MNMSIFAKDLANIMAITVSAKKKEKQMNT